MPTLPKTIKSVSEHRLSTDQGEIHFVLRRSRASRKTVTLTVNPKAEVSVSAPIHTSFQKIEEFMLKKSSWIHRKIKEHTYHFNRLQKRRFCHGSQFLFLGKKHLIDAQETENPRSQISFSPQGWKLDIAVGLSENQKEKLIKEKIMQWYRKEAEEFLAARLFSHARTMDLIVHEVSVRTQRRIWGSCHSHSRKIFLNWQLMMAPIEVIDYVLIHELCHLWVPNHSRRFWQKVAKFNPDYKDHVKWLKTNAYDMILP